MEQDQILQFRAEMEGRQLISDWKAEKRAFFSKPENVDLDCAEIHDFLDGVAQKAALEEIQMHGRVTSTPDEILKKSYAKMLETVKRRQNAQKPRQAEAKPEPKNMSNDDYLAIQRAHGDRIRRPQI